MKLTKLIPIVAALAAFTITAGAQLVFPDQDANTVTQLMPGGTAVIPAASTNTFLTYAQVVSNTNGVLYTNTVVTTNSFPVPQGINVAGNMVHLWEFGSIGFTNVNLTFAFNGTATSTNSLFIYQSSDGGYTFTPSPIWAATNLAPGASTFFTNTQVSVPGGGVLAFVVTGTGTTVSTNAMLECSKIGQPIGTLHTIP